MASLFASLAQGASFDRAHLWRRAELRRGVGDSAVRVLAVMDAADAAHVAAEDASPWPVALGSRDGVTLWRSSLESDGVAEVGRIGETRRLSPLRAVQDLHFAGDGALWIATARGLWRLDADGRLEDRSPGSGEAARWVRRVASLSGVIVATTRAGAYATGDGRRWRRLSRDMPLGPADSLALRSVGSVETVQSAGSERPASPEVDAPGLEVWLSVRGVVRRVRLEPENPLAPANQNNEQNNEPSLATAGALGAWVVTASEPLPPVSGLGAGAVPLQILLHWPGLDAAVLYEHAIAIRHEPGGVWEVVRPVLPAEARAVWLTRAAGSYWLATDRGLLRAEHWRGPWRRAASPVGSAAVFRVAAVGELLLAATGQGLFVGSLAPELPAIRTDAGAIASPPPSSLSPSSLSRMAHGQRVQRPAEPSVFAVQRAALRYLGLGAERTRALRRGIERRGWLPVLSLRIAGSFDRDNAHDYDEAFLSGATRTLRDRDWQSGRDIDASLSLVWDLGDLAYNPEAVTLSREARLLISLRDDVLDQINQAYFERQALLRVLEAEPVAGEQSEGERYKLQLRADELAAGLDGWTGGWFGSQRGEEGTSAGRVD